MAHVRSVATDIRQTLDLVSGGSARKDTCFRFLRVDWLIPTQRAKTPKEGLKVFSRPAAWRMMGAVLGNGLLSQLCRT